MLQSQDEYGKSQSKVGAVVLHWDFGGSDNFSWISPVALGHAFFFFFKSVLMCFAGLKFFRVGGDLILYLEISLWHVKSQAGIKYLQL